MSRETHQIPVGAGRPKLPPNIAPSLRAEINFTAQDVLDALYRSLHGVIEDYVILTDDDPGLLAIKVKEHLVRGYLLLGGLSVALSESDEYRYIQYNQAVVKYTLHGKI